MDDDDTLPIEVLEEDDTGDCDEISLGSVNDTGIVLFRLPVFMEEYCANGDVFVELILLSKMNSELTYKIKYDIYIY